MAFTALECEIIRAKIRDDCARQEAREITKNLREVRKVAYGKSCPCMCGRRANTNDAVTRNALKPVAFQ